MELLDHTDLTIDQLVEHYFPQYSFLILSQAYSLSALTAVLCRGVAGNSFKLAIKVYFTAITAQFDKLDIHVFLLQGFFHDPYI